MLPDERPTLHEQLQPYIDAEEENTDRHFCLNRSYHMCYIPAGFWSRLIGMIVLCFARCFFVYHKLKRLFLQLT